MKIKKVRVQNFRSVADSGELALDEHVTILVGTNECGKTAIMDALRYFNRGENFDDADVSTLTIHDQLFTPGFDRSSIPMVTVWAVLEPDDSTRLALPQAAQEHQIKIIKKLDNDYDVETPWLTAQPPIPSDATTPNPLQTILERIHAVLSNVYEGYVKDKQPNFSHVWLARSEHEDKSDNLVLFPEWAEKIWDDLEQGDWLQVTRIAEGPYGRNPRALNAAFRVDITPLKKTLADIIESVASSGYIDTNLRDLFIGQIHDISPQHPIREYFAPDLLESIADLPSSQPAAIAAADFESWVRDNQPRFIYLAETTEVSDELPIPEYVPHVPGALRRDNLVDALARAAGLNPHVFHPQVAPMSRLAILEAKSQAITERFKYLWQDLNLGFHELGEKLALGVQARGNFAPPSRRSAGLRSFLSLFTELLAFTDRRNVVLLLDDPGVHLHPKKQEEMAKFLGNQACQVVIATHLPHTIDPEGLDKVRAIVRTDDAGSE